MLMIASDIHGSALFTEKLLARFHAEGCTGLLLLGDILYHGPRNDLPEGYAPKEVIAMLNPMKKMIRCTRGNCDAEVDQMVLSFVIEEGMISLEAEGLRICAAHGHHAGPDEPAASELCDVFLSGHTHVPLKKRINGAWYLNPGSVSIPKENSARGYMTLDASGFAWKTLEGKVYDTLPLSAVSER